MLNKFRGADLSLFIIPIVLSILSIALIYSLVFSGEDTILATKQAIFAGIGIIFMFVLSITDYRIFRNIWWLIYFIALVLLLVVDVAGLVSGGAMRWLNLGFFQLQPSEISKIAIIIMLSSFFAGKIEKIRFRDYLFSFILFIIPFGLIIKQPDLGTALVVAFIYFMIVICSKPSKKQLVVIISAFTAILIVSYFSIINLPPFGYLLKEYQRSRIETFLNPSKDPYGQGYNVRQAQITIGSGGLFGKGLGRGSQSQLKFLPKPHTDFIFAGLGEAVGFVGSTIVIITYIFLIYRIFSIASKAKDNFGMLVASGCGAMFFFQSAVNIGMSIGLTPVTGIPLPFLSSGGTALIISFISCGIVQNIHIRQKKMSFN